MAVSHYKLCFQPGVSAKFSLQKLSATLEQMVLPLDLEKLAKAHKKEKRLLFDAVWQFEHYTNSSVLHIFIFFQVSY